MSKHEKFLEFNGQAISILNNKGVWWVALKPILDAIGMDADRSIKNLKKHAILGPERSKQTVQVTQNGQKQGRQMTCLPEKFIYGWIFSLRSDSPDLLEYQRTCYELIYNHFHGAITGRQEILQERALLQSELREVKVKLKEESELYQSISSTEQRIKRLSEQLNVMDKEAAKQPTLFDQVSHN